MTKYFAVLSLALTGCSAFNYEAPDGPRYGGEVESRSGNASIRVATFNVELGRNIALAIAELEAVGPLDVVLLQEMDADGTRRIAEALSMSWVYYPASIQGERDFGNAILSHLPWLEDHKVRLPHRAPFDGRARIAVCALLEGAVGPLFVASVHNETFLLPLPQRLDQARALLEDTHARYGELPGVIAGDFNTLEPEAVEAVGELHERYGFARAAPGPEEATAGTPFGDVTLDLVFTRGVRTQGRGVGASGGASDHRVVWVQLGGD